MASEMGSVKRTSAQGARWIAALLLTMSCLAGCVLPPRPPTAAQILARLKLVNYYPAGAGWTLMWIRFPIAEIRADFAAMHAVGANSVRIILQASTIGYPNPTMQMQSELGQIIAAAAHAGLTTQLTLFDWFGGYTEIANSTHWASVVLRPYRNDPRISFVELKNEVDVTNAAEMRWAQTMYPIVKHDIGPIPLTLSVPGNAPTGALARVKAALPNMDFYDVHDYGSVTSQLSSDKALVAPKPLYIGEAGQSTHNGNAPDTSHGDTNQANFWKSLNAKTVELGLPKAAPWAWSDFKNGTLTWTSPTSSEYGFGLLRTNGTRKPAYSVIHEFWRS